jgi:hypothetical protein
MLQARILLVFAALAMAPMLARAEERVAIKGYDPVAYFTEGKPTPGKSDIETSWQNSRWRFATETNRNLFASDPDKYAPQYGGYCALGMAAGGKYEVDPEQWTIVNGKLYLNYNRGSRNDFRKEVAANIKRADENWARLSQ